MISYINVTGMDNFEDLLAGGHFMDKHFKDTPLEQNVRHTSHF